MQKGTKKINFEDLKAKGYLAPYKYPHFYEHWNQMRNKNIWTVDRISFLQDKVDFENLKPDEQYFVKYLLASFGINELSIGRSWAARLFNTIGNEEITLALTEIMAQEVNHTVSYQKLAEVLGFEKEFPQILKANPILIKRMEALEGKGLDLLESIAVSTYYGEKAALFTSFFLFGDFTQKTGMLCGLNDVNMYSWKDEYILDSSHVKIAQDILQILDFDPLKDSKTIQILTNLLEEVEYPFIDSLPLPTSWGVTKDELKEYVKWRVFDDKNPQNCPERMRKFEEMIRGTDVNAFFERKGAGSYAKDNFVDDWD